MSKFDKFEALSDKAMSLFDQASDSLRDAIPGSAEKWMKSGLAIGAARSGTKIAGGFLRRNPAIIAASAVGVGVAWAIAYQYRKRQQTKAVEGSSRRIEPNRSSGRKNGSRRTSASKN